jgi:transcriptional regulator with XRE-family HTH domain
VARGKPDPKYLRLQRALTEKRIAAGMSQTDLAALLGKPQSYVSKVEAGERGIDVVEFVQFVRAIGADPLRVLRLVLKEP